MAAEPILLRSRNIQAVPPNDDALGEWLPVAAAARKIGISRSSLYGRIARGTVQSRQNERYRREVWVANDQSRPAGAGEIVAPAQRQQTSAFQELVKLRSERDRYRKIARHWQKAHDQKAAALVQVERLVSKVERHLIDQQERLTDQASAIERERSFNQLLRGQLTSLQRVHEGLKADRSLSLWHRFWLFAGKRL